MCDVVYVLLLDEWQRQALVDRQALLSRGVTDNLPSVASARERLDEVLGAEPVVAGAGLSDEQRELRQALGVLA